MELVNINNPSMDGSCQYFDPLTLEATINSITNQKVMVTSLTGDNLCKLSPCSPSPCKNGGMCTLADVMGGYKCTCSLGYAGVKCTIDVNECMRGE